MNSDRLKNAGAALFLGFLVVVLLAAAIIRIDAYFLMQAATSNPPEVHQCR